MSTGKVVLGALAGLAIGAIVGILFAPEKGSVTRKKIRSKGDDYVDDIKSKFNELYDSLTHKAEDGKRAVQDFAEKGKAKFDDAKKEMKNATSEYKENAM